MSGPLILGLESSCDETGVGIVRGHDLLANEVASSVAEHVRFGGVVPEVASRAHLEAMVPTLERACATADVDLAELDGVAVTAEASDVHGTHRHSMTSAAFGETREPACVCATNTGHTSFSTTPLASTAR